MSYLQKKKKVGVYMYVYFSHVTGERYDCLWGPPQGMTLEWSFTLYTSKYFELLYQPYILLY